MAVPGSLYGRGPPIVLENVSCNGSESTISQCNRSGLGRITNPQCSNPDNVAGFSCSIGIVIIYSVYTVSVPCYTCKYVYTFIIFLLQSAMMDQLDSSVVRMEQKA